MKKYKSQPSLNSLLKYGFLTLLSVLVFTGCKNKQKVVDEKKILKNKNISSLVGNMRAGEVSCNWLNAKANIEVARTEARNNFKAVLRMRTDSMIWMSFTALGLEVGRVLMTPDSIKFINRIERQYFLGDYAFLSQKFNVDLDFETMQSLILGNSLEFEGNIEDLKAYEREGFYTISGVRKKKLKKLIEKDKELKKESKIYTVWLNPVNYKIERQTFIDYDVNQSLYIAFGEFIKINEQLLPHRAEVEVKGDQNLTVLLEYTAIELNEERKVSFVIPDKYVQIF